MIDAFPCLERDRIINFKKVKMIKYKNLGRNSGVNAYEIAQDSILVLFSDGGLYLYNNFKPGKSYVDRMKILAVKGSGLNSLITSEIGKNYFSKLA